MNSSALPLVSVCIPTYNGEKFIVEAIASVLTQTYDNLEIIIADDQSQDRTLDLIQALQPHINLTVLIYPHPRWGIAENCNFCVQKAKGKYIKFLFQDDILLPNCITEMVNLAEQDETMGLVFSRREIFFATGDETHPDLIAVYQDFQNLHQSWSALKTIQAGNVLLQDPNLLCHPINKIGEPSTVLIRRDTFEAVGGFDSQLNQLMDLDLWLRIMGSYKIGFLDQCLSQFRLNHNQKTCQNISTNTDIDFDFYLKLYRHPCYNFLDDKIRKKSFLIYHNLLKIQSD